MFHDNMSDHLWHRAHAQEQKWFTAMVDLSTGLSPWQLVFLANMNSTTVTVDGAEVGIDDILVVQEPCLNTSEYNMILQNSFFFYGTYLRLTR